MGEKKEKSKEFFEVILLIALGFFLACIFFFTGTKERSVGDLFSQTQELYTRMLETDLKTARNQLEGFSNGLCESTKSKLERLKEKTQKPEELAKIEQLLEKVNVQQVQTKEMIEEIEEILKAEGVSGSRVEDN